MMLGDEVVSVKTVMLIAGTVWGSSFVGAVLSQFPDYSALAAIAGCMGGASRWIGARQKLWPDGLGSIAAGIMCAVTLWPMGHWIIGGQIKDLVIDPAAAVLFGAFITGVTGVSLIGMIIDLGEIRRRERRDDHD